MSGRWHILALLFAVRTTMAFQFQSVAALAPLIQKEFAVGLADLGMLIGLYLAPGVALAVPGGDIGRRYGDKVVVLAGLGLMACGGLLMACASSWSLQIAGRFVAGMGGVLLNVLMAKMVADWFAGKEIATAMAIFVNSWPVGIALALLVLPVLGTTLGVSAAFALTAALVAVGLLALAAFYRAPPANGAAAATGARPSGAALGAVLLSGLVWGLYNASFAMVFAFGPSLLAERGWSLTAASSATSIVLWLVALSVPLGGWLADRSGRPGAILVGGCLSSAVLLLFAARSEQVIAAFIGLGLVSGLAAGPILALPARVLAPATRASGMGIFFALFYVCVVLAPWVAGLLAGAAGTTQVAFDFGAAMLVACCLVMLPYRRVAASAS